MPQTTALAAPAEQSVSYYKEIRPILQAHCQGCHQPAKPSGQYVMTSFASLLKGGETETPAVVPGMPDDSQLLEMITPDGDQAEMPKGKPPLPAAEREKIALWIRQGAVDDTPPAAATLYDSEHPPTYRALPIITSLDYSPDGKWLAVSAFHEVIIHSADGSERIARLIGISERIESAVFSPDGKWLAVVGGSPARLGELQIWNTDTWELVLSVPVLYDTIYGASWSPDGRYVAFGCPDNSVRAVDAQSGEQVLLQRAPNDWTLDTVFSVDGSHVVSVGRDMTVKLIEFATQRFVDNITSITPGALKGGILAVDRHPARDEVLVGGDDGVPRSYRLFRKTDRRIGDDSNLIRRFPPMSGRIFDVEYASNGELVVCGSSFNGQGQVHAYSIKYSSDIPEAIAKIESKTVFERSAEEKAELEKYYTSEVTLLAAMEGQAGAVYAVALSPDAKQIASGGFDGLVRLNEPATGKLIGEFTPVPLEGRQ
jgi:WD40 repeat protein